MLARTLTLLAVLVIVPAVRADDAADADAKVKEYLKGIKGAEAARVTPLTGDGMKEAFPDHTLFGVLFPLYPIAHGVFETRSTTSLLPCMSREPSLKSLVLPRTASRKYS